MIVTENTYEKVLQYKSGWELALEEGGRLAPIADRASCSNPPGGAN